MTEAHVAHDSIARELELTLADVLGFEAGAPIDRARPFKAIGLDSLLAMDFALALEPRFGKLPETTLKDYPTITALAAYLENRSSTLST